MSGKVILITGASSGMGRVTAEQLAEEGHIVYGAARRVDRMKDLEAKGGHALAMDVTKDETIVAGIEHIIAEHGRIDVLVNNAGFGLYGSVEETSLDDARYQMEVNLFGLARLTQLVLPHMRTRKEGKIINISSMGGKVYTPLGAWYHATKHALEGWSDCLRIEVAAFGIDVVIVEPGAIKTEFGDVMAEPMLERSGHGPYAPMANALAKMIKQSFEKGDASPPSVISNTISEAIAKRRPRTRYARGKYAKPMMFVRKWLGDRVFDRAVMALVR